MDGVLIVDKPSGLTSHDVVADVRRITRQRRIGHGGTLDPLATGVLVLALGRATRLLRFMSGARKSYRAGIRLGVATDTFDAEGLARTMPPPDDAAGPPPMEDVARAMERFRGRFAQVPPAYSAKKMGGERAYALARANVAVSPAPVMVEVFEFEIESLDGTLLQVRLTCSAGCYVRSIAHDLGAALGCGGHVESLRRTRSGTFGEADAVALAALQASPGKAADRLIPIDALLDELPAARLTERGASLARHGAPVVPEVIETWVPAREDEGQRLGVSTVAGMVRLISPEGRLIGVAAAGASRDAPLRPLVNVG